MAAHSFAWRLKLLTAAVFLTWPSFAEAELVFKDSTIDLGEVRAGQPLRVQALLVNSGKTAVEVLEIKPGCNCLATKLDANRIPAGRREGLLLYVHSLNLPAGAQTWSVKAIYKEGEATREAMLTMKANVIQEIVVQPPSLNVASASATQHEIRVTDTRGKPFNVTQVECSDKHLKATLGKPEKDAKGRPTWAVTLLIEEAMPAGSHSHWLSIVTDDPTYPALHVRVDVTRKAKRRVSAFPGEVQLIGTAKQPNPTRMVTLRDDQGQPVDIEKIESDNPAITFSFAEGTNKVGNLKVAVDTAKLNGGPLKGKLKVHLREPVAEVIEIAVVCESP